MSAKIIVKPPKNEGNEGDESVCPFDEFGCDYTGGKHNVKKHIKDTPERHLHILCEGVKDFGSEMGSVQIYMEKEDRMLEDLTYRIGQLTTTFSKTLVWRIDNYRSKYQDARQKKRTTFFSPPFYTGKNGYKMAASVALYGDGKERGKYMSVFLSILKGEYDTLLHWPFPCPVTFTLIEQRTDEIPNVHAVKTVKPNTCKQNRPFLGRPVGERNPSFGVQKFVALEEMKQKRYIRDDVIFIEIDIDTFEVPEI